MNDLIKALQIFLKYGNHKYPTHCEHDLLYITGIKVSEVSKRDKSELEQLGFTDDGEYFCSYRYGSS